MNSVRNFGRMGTINLHIEPHSEKASRIISDLRSDTDRGLSSDEAAFRLKTHGTNRIEDYDKRRTWRILIAQFSSPIVWILAIAGGMSFYFGENLDAIAIAVVILINAFIGFLMEFQAERSMNALRKMTQVRAKVLRNNKAVEINCEEVVPGDIVLIEAGDMITADGRIISASLFHIDESSLTGESVPVEKGITELPLLTQLAERTNMLYKGTFCTKGNGRIVVTGTGMNTELGKIASMVQSADQQATPLEKKLEDFSKKLIWITVGLVIVIFVAGILNGQKFLSMLETSIALAVAAIPEGLPIVATVALAQGMLKMARYNVIVKKLSAVETLGGTNIICSDKTGTLTLNKIEVGQIVTSSEGADLIEILNRVAVLCNTAELSERNGVLTEIGDPLETGLLLYVKKNQINIDEYRLRFPKLKEEPFSSDTKIMSSLHLVERELIAYAKGAPEEILRRCNRLHENGIRIDFTKKDREYWLRKSDELSASGLKVIAAAYKPISSKEENISMDLVFVGLFGLIDPPREDVYAAVEECKSAGISVTMITGDHPSTARNIALKLGIVQDDNCNVIEGKAMGAYADLSEGEKAMWLNTKIFARVSPAQKLDLISVLQERKNVVGMTGDGVNDAPALKKADIGIAMGLKGTQVAQDVADMILKDDSFSSIVTAIKQGRVIFDNIRKFVIYLISCNLSELLVIATASILNLHFQLFALQILFINLITDVLPALALGVTKGSPDIMKRPPLNSTTSIIDRKRWISIFFYSGIIAATSIGAVLFSHLTVHQSEMWNPALCNNILFFTLIFSQLLHVFNMGSDPTSFFRSEVFRNKYVWAAIALSLSILIGLYAIEPVRNVLSLFEMSINDWLIAIGASFVSLIIIQLGKKMKIAQQ